MAMKAPTPVDVFDIGRYRIVFWGKKDGKAVVSVLAFGDDVNTVPRKELKLYNNVYGDYFKVSNKDFGTITLHLALNFQQKVCLVHHGRGW